MREGRAGSRGIGSEDQAAAVQGRGYRTKYTYSGDRIKEAWTTDAAPKRKFAFGYDDQTNLSAISVYDSAGTNIVSTTCLVHDGLNRLAIVGPAKNFAGPDTTACRTEADVNSVQVRFRYDAQNRRVARQDGSGSWKQYISAPDGALLSELTPPILSGGAWDAVRDYVWLDGKLIAQIEYPGPQVYSAHVDHLGLPRALTSSTNAIAWSATTRPYGDLAETSSTGVVTNLRLPGQYDERLLGALGLQGPYQNWNRWYLPMAGRYLELDPIALGGGFNAEARPDWYGYVEGSPLSNTDPDGRNTAAGALGGAVVCGPVCAALGAAIGTGVVWLAACSATHTCPWDHPIPLNPPKCEPAPPDPPCEPCQGPLPPMRIDEDHSHKACPGAHVHYFVWDQNPKTCACFPGPRYACL
jgi:RHS repeat-associated protein